MTSFDAAAFQFRLDLFPDFHAALQAIDSAPSQPAASSISGVTSMPPSSAPSTADAPALYGPAECHRILVTRGGVRADLAPLRWVENHWRWVVWKAAAMERTLPRLCGGRLLTPAAITAQLAARYEVAQLASISRGGTT